MARPIKIGVDYFPLDVDLDIKTKLLKAEFGVLGYGILIRLYQLIYSENGYYVDWNDTVNRLFSAQENIKETTLSEVIVASIKLDLFSKEKFEQFQILTSRGIQKRYLEITKRRQINELNANYILLNAQESGVNVDNNSINVDNNSINVDKSTQRKVKESKVKEIKKIYGVYKRVKLTKDEFEKLKKNHSNYQDLISFLDEYIEMKGEYKVKNHYLAIVRWVVDAVSEQSRKKGRDVRYEVPAYKTPHPTNEELIELQEWLKKGKEK